MIGAPAIHKSEHRERIKPRAPVLTAPFSKDRLNLVSRDAAATGAFAMLDRVQQERPELAMASIAMLFATMCERLGVNPHDGHTLGMKLLRHQDYHHKANCHVEALDDLAKEQWQGKVL